jgi:hypothetical protein
MVFFIATGFKPIAIRYYCLCIVSALQIITGFKPIILLSMLKYRIEVAME